MKKLIFLTLITGFFSACHNDEKTDESKPYGTTDTNRVEPVNSHADSSHQD